MSAKKINSNTEKNNDTEKTQELTSMYSDMVMERITLTENKISEFFDLLHKLMVNPYKLKSVDRLLDFTVKFKHKIELPYFISNIIFEENVRITGFELKGSVVYFDYETNNGGEYRYYIDFGADKLITKEYVLFRLVFERIDDSDFFEITNVLSDIISEIDSERNYVLKMLKDNGAKIEN